MSFLEDKSIKVQDGSEEGNTCFSTHVLSGIIFLSDWSTDIILRGGYGLKLLVKAVVPLNALADLYLTR
ncbi:MAG: hypothetical protein RIG62_29850 [Cyclobacteriaceae bacterium]